MKSYWIGSKQLNVVSWLGDLFDDSQLMERETWDTVLAAVHHEFVTCICVQFNSLKSIVLCEFKNSRLNKLLNWIETKLN